MALSEQEQQALREIEKSLFDDDPRFGRSVTRGSALGGSGGGLSLRVIAVGVIGLLLLLGGVMLAQSSLWFIAVSVVGFLVMFGAGVWGLRGSRASERHPEQATRAASDSRGRRSAFGSSMDDTFRQRFER